MLYLYDRIVSDCVITGIQGADTDSHRVTTLSQESVEHIISDFVQVLMSGFLICLESLE